MWLAPSGQEMTEVEWGADHVKCLGVLLSGDHIGEGYENGVAILGDTILYLMNASPAPVPFTLPSFAMRPRWETVLDTFDDGRVGEVRGGSAVYPLCAHSLAVFTLHRDRNDRLS
jgi:isoamylase